jgi:hypothetical protein
MEVSLAEFLRSWANQMSTRFGAPTYLVGSALELPDPRDIDVRVMLTNDDFEARYGDPIRWREALWFSRHDGSMRYCTDMWQLSAEAARVLRLNIDFQVQPPCEWLSFVMEPRLRLDSISDLPIIVP